MAELVILYEGAEQARTRLGTQPLSLGRRDDCDIAIANAKVSRMHARIFLRDERWVYEDLDSANGSFFGEEKIKERVLADGDKVKVGDHDLMFLEKDGTAAGEGAPDLDSSRIVSRFSSDRDWELLQSVLIDPRAGRAGAERLQALFEISKSLEEAKDFQAVLVQIMDKAIGIMGGERGFLMLVEPDGELRVHVARDLTGDITGVDRETVSRSLMRRVLTSGEAMVVLDAQAEEWRTQSVLANSIHAAICAPLMTRDVVSGVIYVDHRSRPNVFTDEDLAFFTTFALQAKSAIDSSRAYWELVDSLFRASDDFIVVCSPEGKITQVNRAAAELLGRSAEAFVGQSFADLVIEDDRSRAAEVCGETVDKGVVSGCDLRLIGDAREVPMSVSSFAMRDRVGNPIGVCLIGRDLTVLKELIAGLEVRNEFIRKTFGRYLSDEIVNSLLESPKGLDLGGGKRQVTILMSDLRGFTSMAERLAPEQVVRILNHYLGEMVEVITRYQGTIDEFIGDAILVIFGAPEVREDDAVRAAACAIDMQRAMAGVNAWTRDNDLPELEMGIGLNTGDVVVGNIGSAKRSKYAVVGRHVNLTSRIEGNTVGGQVLISDGTRLAAGDPLILGEQHALSVKGVEGKLVVYDLQGVGAPFDLKIPTAPLELRELRQPLPIRFAVLDGKQVGTDSFTGELLELGPKGAVLRLGDGLELSDLTNLSFWLDGADGAELPTAYCKVVDSDLAAETAQIRFTSIPPEVAKLFATAV